jgi:hypothetical protein
MCNTLHIRVATILLLVELPVLAQKFPTSKPNLQRTSSVEQRANKTLRPAETPLGTQTASQPVSRQQVSDCNSTAPKPQDSKPLSPKESFSQLTLFLFGSGLALFIALLGWSDQIRNIDQDTKELERRFLDHSGIRKSDFLRIVKPKSPDEQLEALTAVVSEGRIKTRASATVLQTFKRWNTQWSRLELLHTWKYALTIALTIVLFAVGIVSLFTTPVQEVNLRVASMRAEMLLLVVPLAVIGALLTLIVCSAVREQALRALLNSMADMV